MTKTIKLVDDRGRSWTGVMRGDEITWVDEKTGQVGREKVGYRADGAMYTREKSSHIGNTAAYGKDGRFVNDDGTPGGCYWIDDD